MVKFRNALLAHTVDVDPAGIRSIKDIVNGTRNVCERLPTSIPYTVVVWVQGQPNEEFTVSLTTTFDGAVMSRSPDNVGEVPSSGEGAFPIPLQVTATRPGRYGFLLFINGERVWAMEEFVEVAAPSSGRKH